MAQLVVRLRGWHEAVGSIPSGCVTLLAKIIPVLSGRLVIHKLRIARRKTINGD